MERKFVAKLDNWKNDPARKPLVISGARQVGKTHTMLSYGKESYKNTVYINLEGNTDAQAIFERDLNPERIIRELSAYSGQSIFPTDTLIVFDEIQACERTLTSLKYFCENAPQYHIMAAGSLLGVAIKREKYSFPVGKVDMMTMFPMDFEEFLWAIDKAPMTQLIRESFDGFSPLSLHDTALDLYKLYLVIGGMPEAVLKYIATQDFNFVVAAQKSINDSYIADMAKYATPHETTRIKAAWDSLPAQLSKENRKFQYKAIKSGARAYDYETPLDWMTSAGIINKCVRITEGKLPLVAYADNDSFKIYMMDTGLLCSKFGIAANVIMSGVPSFDGFKGALAENYICQCLVTNGIIPFYWASPGKAELDFAFQDQQGNIVPLEAKSADNVKSKSLNRFVELYKPEYAIRVSAKNFGYENGIKSVPLYAVFCVMP
ncbi:MAG: ATP-binding protein [Oscillospiraceae bacterium]|nr:ATP-binding protein [Oscillospiraceae bacterium]